MEKPRMRLEAPIEAPVRLSVEPYISEAYARGEKERLWGKVWQFACREEEIPNPGDFYTYDILDQSVIVTRVGPDQITAYHNVCTHRGKRLTEGCGNTKRFYCGYHGWQWNLQGENIRILDRENWQGRLRDEDVCLRSVKVGRWGGFVFINLDPGCEPLETFLQGIPTWLGPLELEKMRYKWRKWLRYPANWKVVVEAFIEGYHAEATHPQTQRYGIGKTASRAEGLHARMWSVGTEGGGIGTFVGKSNAVDPREIPYLTLEQAAQTVWANYSDTFLAAARRLPEILPETATPTEVAARLMEVACQMDAERGVIWPRIEADHLADLGINWHVFPNAVLLPNVTFCLGFRIRPDGFDPDRCITEIFTLERFPEGQEPETEWVHAPEATEENWPLLVRQDFAQMHQVQQGMRSGALRWLVPNPLQEAGVVNFQRNLAAYMGQHAPEKL